MSLIAFMAQNAVQEENIKFVASNRFIDEKTKKPIEWELKCVDSQKDEELRKSCTKTIEVRGKKGQYTKDTDFDKYVGKLAVECIVFPNLNDAELQNSYGVMGAEALLKKMLKPGEYANLLSKVQEINGFNETFDEKVEEAKN